MDELSPSSTPGSRTAPPPPIPPTATTTGSISDDSEKKATRQRRLSFGIPETPAAPAEDQSSQIAGLLKTVAELERTTRRTRAENEELRAKRAADDIPKNEGSPTQATLAELTSKLSSLAEVVSALADQQARTKTKAKATRTAGYSGSDSDPDFSSDSDSDSDSASDPDRNTNTLRETGPACVSIFCRSIEYTISDPDRISDRHDVDGIDSDYRRISDKRPLMLSDLTDNTAVHGSQLKEVASRLYKRIFRGLKPQPSPQCAIGLSIFALHDQLSEVIRCRLQSAILAARNCTTRREIKTLIRTCQKTRRVPSAMLQQSATLSDSPLLKAIKTEAAASGDRFIRSVWELVVTIISMDRNPAITLSAVEDQWRSLEGGDVETVLFREQSLYSTAVTLLGTNKGAKPFVSFEDRTNNILRCRTTTTCDVKSAFNDRLELDQLDLIDLDWDDVWDRLIDAEAAATRKNKRGNHSNQQRPPSADPPPTDNILMPCILHGPCGHETPNCKTLRRYPSMPASAVRILKHNHICVIGYGEKHPEGACGREDCKFKHVTPEAAQAIINQPAQQFIGRQQSLVGSSLGPPAASMLHSNIRPAPTLPALPPPDGGDSLFASFGMITPYLDDEADC